MIYVADSGFYITACQYYFPSQFPKFWNCIDELIGAGRFVSPREVLRELDKKGTSCAEWANNHKNIFVPPTHEETVTLSDKLFSHNTFLQISDKVVRAGRPWADPWVVVKAKHLGGCVVTTERYKKHSARIPNMCEHLGVECVDLEGFLKQNGLKF